MKTNNVLREYVKKLSDDELKFIHQRLTQRIDADVAEAVDFIQHSPEMDKWLLGADGADDFFDMIDQVDEYVEQEVKKRFAYSEKVR